MELTAPECRVLGCLIEKERTTPQNYPLTLNSLRLACNQTTNRDPVVAYDDQTIETALASLREQQLTRIVYSTSNRATKYRHVLDDILHVGDDGLAVLAVLLLRGPQTTGEIKSRSERLHAFADLAAVQSTMDRLADHRDGPLVIRYERRPGQKDARWGHLLGGPVDTSAPPEPAAAPAPWPANPVPGGDEDAGGRDGGDGDGAGGAGRPARPGSAAGSDELSSLRDEVADLRRQVAALRDEFDAFRDQFA